MGNLFKRVMVAAALMCAACTTSQTEVPGLTGPSELALSVRMVAIPDSISQDGASQSSVVVTVFDANGKACANMPLRLEMGVGGQVQDFGGLSARTIVTGSDGKASVTYTAPPAPPPLAGGSGNTVIILATPSTSVNCNRNQPVGNFDASNRQQVAIRLVPPGVILSPAESPTAAFTMSPNQALMNVPVTFDGSQSCPAAADANGNCFATSNVIRTYIWDFGDGTPQASGRSVSHTFRSQQTFNVTLTVTNDRGLSASRMVPTPVGALPGPGAQFVFSPTAPQPGQAAVFNASQSSAAPGHTLTSFNWNFGDGGTGSGVTTSHTFAAVGTYNVVLTVTDDVGQTSSSSVAVTVTAGSGGGSDATAAHFVIVPASPIATQAAVFNGSTSTAASGRTLTTFAWTFGDGASVTGSTSTASHTYATSGAFPVRLTVTDSTGQQSSDVQTVTVQPASSGALTADFTISPTDPFGGDLVTFNANTSTPILSIVSFDWDFGDGVIVNGQTTPIINHTYSTFAGNTFTIRLTVHDNLGRQNSVPKTLTVGPNLGNPPVARFSISQNPTTINTGVTFNPTASTVAGGKTVAAYQWDFGDGSPVVSTTPGAPTINHSYAVAGTYTITLTVVDNGNLTGSTAHTLLVQ